MSLISLLFLIAAALLGLTLLIYILKNKHTPKAFLLSHGFLATAGLLLLIIDALANQIELLYPAILLAIAALGGFVLGIRDLLGLSVPKWFAISHGTIALIGLATLILLQI